MKTKSIKALLSIAVVLLILAGLFVTIRNLPFFEIKQVNVSFSENVSENSIDVQKIVNPLKGLNLFEVGKSRLDRKLSNVDFVENVKIKRFFPSTLNIEIIYKDIVAGFISQNLEGTEYYLADKSGLYECKYETFRIFTDIPYVNISANYAKQLEQWGFDTGFKQMLNLVEGISLNSLISGIKYDNNNLSGFGRLILDFESIGTKLRVMEPVEQDRMLEAIEIIEKRANKADKVFYDLYSVTLVRRNQEEEIGSR